MANVSTPSRSSSWVSTFWISSVQRRTWHWPNRMVMPRSKISIIGIGSISPP